MGTARSARRMAMAVALALAGCGKDADSTAEAPLAVDLSGTWAGTWSGSNQLQGYVTGTWEASVTQTSSGITGTMLLGGDVDCPDATVAGAQGDDGVVHGTIERPPCEHNEWTLTSLDLLSRTLTGVWTQPASQGAGTFTGTQVARPGGPRISFIAPPSGPPGTLVTIVGQGFAPAAASGTLVDFDGVPAALTMVGLDSATARVPPGAPSGRIALSTRYGTAMSPRPFDARPSFPRPVTNAEYPGFALPDGIALGPDGRRAYVANRATGRITMLDLRVGVALATTPVDLWETLPVQGLAVSPDGRRVYAASGPGGVTVLDTAMNVVVDVLPVAAGDGAHDNPQGIAVSPDGRTLFVADARDGGAVSVVDLAAREVVATVSRGPGASPSGVAVSPDGRRAYLAFSGAGALDVFDVEGNATVATIPAGAGAVAVAVSPDGARLWVTSAEEGRAIEIDAEALSTAGAVAVGASPQGIAFSPDGSRLYVANRGSGTLSVVDVQARAVEDTIPVCAGPVGVAMSSDGMRALVTCADDHEVVEIGGPYTLTVVIEGGGIGKVTSSPEGILCGGIGGHSCMARFAPGTSVALSATPDAASYFGGWGGDCASDGRVSMDANRTCTASFGYAGGSGSDVAHCFVATAAYGDANAREVRVLRAFRDGTLLTNAPGRALVRAYYALSPPLARFIARDEARREVARAALAPVVWAVARPRDALLAALAVAAAALLVVRRRGRAGCAP